MFPSRALFKPIAECQRMDSTELADCDETRWAGIPALAALGELDGLSDFASVRVAWNEAGLWVLERVAKPSGVVTVNRRNPASGDGLQVWIDTRSSQTSHRATRYCHHFVLLPKGGGPDRQEPTAWQTNIRRARERAPLCDPGSVKAAAQVGAHSYVLEAHFPARVLQGYEANAGVRIGFNYFAHDIHSGRQVWSSPRDLPLWDPSLWGVLELVD